MGYNIQCDGNSLTEGSINPNLADRYPNILDTYPNTDFVSNLGLGGLTTSQLATRNAIGLKFSINEVFVGDPCVLWEITNDLFQGASAAEAVTHYWGWCDLTRALGVKIIAVTVLPRFVAGSWTEVARQTVNTRLRAEWSYHAHGLADVAADTRIGDAGDYVDTTYYVDGLHLNGAGNQIVAALVYNTILTLLDDVVVEPPTVSRGGVDAKTYHERAKARDRRRAQKIAEDDELRALLEQTYGQGE